MRALFICLALLGSSASNAIVITVEPDDFFAGQDISNVASGVTLSTFSGILAGPATLGPVFAAEDTSCATRVECLAITGTRVFGAVPAGNLFMSYQLWTARDYLSLGGNPCRGACSGPFSAFRADFLEPTNYVEISIANSRDGQDLYAYGVSGALIGSCRVGSLGSPTPECATFLGEGGLITDGPLQMNALTFRSDQPDIAFIIAGSFDQGGVVDRFRFSVPEPGALSLLVAGLGLLLALPRRRRRDLV